MRKFPVAVACVVLVACGFWLKNHGSMRFGATDRLASTKRPGPESDSDPEAPGSFRTKVAHRETAGPRVTHSPARLKEFMLPEVVIDGLTLGEALQKLMGVYEETCGKTGETPLRLTFDLPPGNAKKLNLKLSPRNFNSSVQLLAAYSGMKVNRNKLAYNFEPFPDERKQVSLAIQVPPDFSSALSKSAGVDSEKDPECPPCFSIGEILKVSGLDLDPSTRLSLSASGMLDMETSSSTDAAMISALADTLGSEKPLQYKFTSQVVEINASTDWTPPDVSQMTADQVQSMMREIADNQGMELTTLPSITGRPGQNTTVEMLRELTVPTDNSKTATRANFGKSLQITASPLGFGQDTTVGYIYTIAAPDEPGKKITVTGRNSLSNSGYADDGGSRLIVQARQDGSKTLLIVTSQLTDATGRPLDDGE